MKLNPSAVWLPRLLYACHGIPFPIPHTMCWITPCVDNTMR
jgi:hypothetical protein